MEIHPPWHVPSHHLNYKNKYLRFFAYNEAYNSKVQLGRMKKKHKNMIKIERPPFDLQKVVDSYSK